MTNDHLLTRGDSAVRRTRRFVETPGTQVEQVRVTRCQAGQPAGRRCALPLRIS